MHVGGLFCNFKNPKVWEWKFQNVSQSSEVRGAVPELWLRCSGMNNHQPREERIWLLERQVAVSWKKLRYSSQPVHIWVMGTKMHMLFHAWVNITETETHILMIFHKGKKKEMQTQQDRPHTHKLTVGLKDYMDVYQTGLFHRHDFMSVTLLTREKSELSIG